MAVGDPDLATVSVMTDEEDEVRYVELNGMEWN
jgi:hypothetical protein